MAFHPRSVPTTVTSPHPTWRLAPLRTALPFLLAATMALGAVTDRPVVTPAFSATAPLADGSSTVNGPCWGCGG